MQMEEGGSKKCMFLKLNMSAFAISGIYMYRPPVPLLLFCLLTSAADIIR